MSAKVWDPNWKYTPAVETDIRKRFAKVRRELLEAAKAKEAAEQEAMANVSTIKPRIKGKA